MVSPLLTYGAEVWGFHSAEDIERLHLKFCKRILKVGKSSSNAAAHGELGRFPLSYNRKLRILKYWLKIFCNKNTLLFYIYSISKFDADNGNNYNGLNWASQVKQLSDSLGMSFVKNMTEIYDYVNVVPWMLLKQNITFY